MAWITHPPETMRLAGRAHPPKTPQSHENDRRARRKPRPNGFKLTLVRRCSLLAALTIVVVMPAGAAQGATLPAGRPICLPVSATGVGQDLGGGNTQATISIRGVVVGRTKASFTTSQVVGTIASFTGPIVFSSSAGTLTAQVAGTVNLATGAFQATSTSIIGAGLLRGITGRVTLVGHENLTTGTFTETLTGQLCGGTG